MKGKDLAEIALRYKDFEFEFSFTEEPKEGDRFLTVRTFNNLEICDIGHSSKELSLTGDEASSKKKILPFFSVGDYAWLTETFVSKYWKSGQFRWSNLDAPVCYKVIQIVTTKDGYLYQTKHGHIKHEWIGDTVFKTKEEALIAMSKE